jgi:hypothetical protein
MTRFASGWMPICAATAKLTAGDEWLRAGGAILARMPTSSGMGPVDESRRADDEAAAIAAERIRSGAAENTEDGAEALASLGIALPEEDD